jgi:predicted small lipoprotein YifL
MIRSFIALMIAFAVGACGIRGSLEKPAGAPPPSLYERAFGQDAPDVAPNVAPNAEPNTAPPQLADDANTTENAPK